MQKMKEQPAFSPQLLDRGLKKEEQIYSTTMIAGNFRERGAPLEHSSGHCAPQQLVSYSSPGKHAWSGAL